MPKGMERLSRYADGVREYVVTDRTLRNELFGSHIDAYYENGAIYYRSKRASKIAGLYEHERTHYYQEQIFGPTLFKILYGLGCVFGYYMNPFEV